MYAVGIYGRVEVDRSSFFALMQWGGGLYIRKRKKYMFSMSAPASPVNSYKAPVQGPV